MPGLPLPGLTDLVMTMIALPLTLTVSVFRAVIAGVKTLAAVTVIVSASPLTEAPDMVAATMNVNVEPGASDPLPVMGVKLSGTPSPLVSG